MKKDYVCDHRVPDRRVFSSTHLTHYFIPFYVRVLISSTLPTLNRPEKDFRTYEVRRGPSVSCPDWVWVTEAHSRDQVVSFVCGLVGTPFRHPRPPAPHQRSTRGRGPTLPSCPPVAHPPDPTLRIRRTTVTSHPSLRVEGTSRVPLLLEIVGELRAHSLTYAHVPTGTPLTSFHFDPSTRSGPRRPRGPDIHFCEFTKRITTVPR